MDKPYQPRDDKSLSCLTNCLILWHTGTRNIPGYQYVLPSKKFFASTVGILTSILCLISVAEEKIPLQIIVLTL